MKLTVDHYTQSTITWEAAHRIALVASDSFRHDFLRAEFYPERYKFHEPLPEICDYEELIQKAKAFKELVEAGTRHMYLRILTDSRAHALVFSDAAEAGVQDVGASLIVLPQYVNPGHTISWTHRVRIWVLSQLFKLQDWWVFGSAGSPILEPAIATELQLGSAKCGALATPERLSELESLSSDELAKIPYPSELMYRLAMFCVMSGCQGRGYGRVMMDETIARMRQMTIRDPPSLRGPAKFGFFSSPDARNFYKRCGFSVGAVWDHKLQSGNVLPHTYFYMNLT